MKTIGLIGGMSWESTRTYYEIINRGVRERLGGLHSARLVLYSVDFDPIERLQTDGDWDEAGRILASAARGVQSAGAEFLLLCTNTMHRVAERVQEAVSIPLVHIADTTAAALKSAGAYRVGLVGTRYTMEQAFYRGRLEKLHDLDVLVPSDREQTFINRVIYEELCRGVVNDVSRRHVLEAIHDLEKRGAQAVILGCTEISLLVSQADTATPLYDTTALHAEAAVDAALEHTTVMPARGAAAPKRPAVVPMDRRARPRPTERRDPDVRGSDLGE